MGNSQRSFLRMLDKNYSNLSCLFRHLIVRRSKLFNCRKRRSEFWQRQPLSLSPADVLTFSQGVLKKYRTFILAMRNAVLGFSHIVIRRRNPRGRVPARRRCATQVYIYTSRPAYNSSPASRLYKMHSYPLP